MQSPDEEAEFSEEKETDVKNPKEKGITGLESDENNKENSKSSNENEKQIEIKTKNDESMENSIELPDSTSEIFSEIKGMFNSKEKEGTNSSGDNDNENENIEASVETENKKQGYKNKYTDKRISSDEKTSSGKKLDSSDSSNENGDDNDSNDESLEENTISINENDTSKEPYNKNEKYTDNNNKMKNRNEKKESQTSIDPSEILENEKESSDEQNKKKKANSNDKQKSKDSIEIPDDTDEVFSEIEAMFDTDKNEENSNEEFKENKKEKLLSILKGSNELTGDTSEFVADIENMFESEKHSNKNKREKDTSDENISDSINEEGKETVEDKEDNENNSDRENKEKDENSSKNDEKKDGTFSMLNIDAPIYEEKENNKEKKKPSIAIVGIPVNNNGKTSNEMNTEEFSNEEDTDNQYSSEDDEGEINKNDEGKVYSYLIPRDLIITEETRSQSKEEKSNDENKSQPSNEIPDDTSEIVSEIEGMFSKEKINESSNEKYDDYQLDTQNNNGKVIENMDEDDIPIQPLITIKKNNLDYEKKEVIPSGDDYSKSLLISSNENTFDEPRAGDYFITPDTNIEEDIDKNEESYDNNPFVDEDNMENYSHREKDDEFRSNDYQIESGQQFDKKDKPMKLNKVSIEDEIRYDMM